MILGSFLLLFVLGLSNWGPELPTVNLSQVASVIGQTTPTLAQPQVQPTTPPLPSPIPTEINSKPTTQPTVKITPILTAPIISRPLIYGINPPNAASLANSPEMQAKIIESCAKVMRVGFDFQNIGALQSSWSWGDYDTVYNFATTNNIEIVALINGSPRWANGGKDESTSPPDDAHKDKYVEFLQNLASHYPKIKYYEFWNEANCGGWRPYDLACNSQQKAADYLKWMKITYEILKGVNPNLLISTTGDDDTDTSWTQLLYAQSAGNNSCNGKPCWDAIGFHSYPIDFDGRLKATHDLMVKNGDTNKPIWITEYGKKNGGMNGGDISNTLNRLASNDFSYVTIAAYHDIADTDNENLGLLDKDLNPKSNGSFGAFQSIVCQK